MAELAAPGDRGRLSAGLLVVAGLILAMAGLALAPATRRGLLRVVSGDPVTVDWRLEPNASTLVLELRAVRAAAPLELEALLVERRLAELLEPEPPAGLVEAGAAFPPGFSPGEWVAWVGSVVLEPGGTTRLEVPLAGARAGAGRLVLAYRYRSVLSTMCSSATVDVEIAAAEGPRRTAGRRAPGPGGDRSG